MIERKLCRTQVMECTFVIDGIENKTNRYSTQAGVTGGGWQLGIHCELSDHS